VASEVGLQAEIIRREEGCFGLGADRMRRALAHLREGVRELADERLQCHAARNRMGGRRSFARAPRRPSWRLEGLTTTSHNFMHNFKKEELKDSLDSVRYNQSLLRKFEIILFSRLQVALPTQTVYSCISPETKGA
jgi:hypothetical protein